MELQITVRNLELSSVIDEHIRKKSDKLKKYENANFAIAWVCTYEKDKHLVEAKITDAHINLHASAETENLYKSVDQVVAKLEKQLKKHKSKMHLGIRRVASIFVRKNKDHT